MWNPSACAQWCPQTCIQGWGQPQFCEGLRRGRWHWCCGEAKGSVPAWPAAGQGTAGKGTHHRQGVILACGAIMPLYHDLMCHTGSPIAALLLQYILMHKWWFLLLLQMLYVGDATFLHHCPCFPEALLWRVLPGAGKAKVRATYCLTPHFYPFMALYFHDLISSQRTLFWLLNKEWAF